MRTGVTRTKVQADSRPSQPDNKFIVQTHGDLCIERSQRETQAVTLIISSEFINKSTALSFRSAIKYNKSFLIYTFRSISPRRRSCYLTHAFTVPSAPVCVKVVTQITSRFNLTTLIVTLPLNVPLSATKLSNLIKAAHISRRQEFN